VDDHGAVHFFAKSFVNDGQMFLVAVLVEFLHEEEWLV